MQISNSRFSKKLHKKANGVLGKDISKRLAKNELIK
jgi:hypothetical protein